MAGIIIMESNKMSAAIIFSVVRLPDSCRIGVLAGRGNSGLVVEVAIAPLQNDRGTR
jgi:hypothetical protein